MNVIVTGASGFIGAEIVSELLENALSVIRVGGKNRELKHRLSSEEFVYKIDITDEGDVERLRNKIALGDKVDALIHCAGLAHQFKKVGDSRFWQVNVEGTRNIIRMAHHLKVRHIILISSVAVYGRRSSNAASEVDTFEEDRACHPVGIYAETKYESEKTALYLCAQYDIALTILRPATVIGEEDAGNFRRLIEAIDKKRFIWIGKGKNQKSLVYKRDVARACVHILKNKTGNTEIFNVTAEALEMKQIVKQIAAHLKRRIPRFEVSEKLLNNLLNLNTAILRNKRLKQLEQTIEKWLESDVFSGRKLRENYGFEARTPVGEAIGREVDWYLRRK